MPFAANNADNWQAFERFVADEVSKLDSNATVEHDAKLQGVHSGIERQIDVLASVRALGATMQVVYECKLYKRAVGIGTVEEFIGKILDLRVDRGVLCVFGNITPSAFHRLLGVLHPRLDLYIWHRDNPTLFDREPSLDEENWDAIADWDRRMEQVRRQRFHFC